MAATNVSQLIFFRVCVTRLSLDGTFDFSKGIFKTFFKHRFLPQNGGRRLFSTPFPTYRTSVPRRPPEFRTRVLYFVFLLFPLPPTISRRFVRAFFFPGRQSVDVRFVLLGESVRAHARLRPPTVRRLSPWVYPSQRNSRTNKVLVFFFFRNRVIRTRVSPREKRKHFERDRKKKKNENSKR